MFPRLRFKKFDGDWEKTTIGAKSETVTSGSRDWAQYYSDSGDKFIRMTNLVRNGINLDLSDLRFVQLPVGSNEGKRTSLEKGDILISITAELGKLGWIPEGLGTAYINQHTALVRMKNTLDSKFVAYALSTEKYNNKLNSLNDSGAKAGLNLGSIRSFELTIPSKPEQTQNASYLSGVDEKISQLTQKLELLSQYKQGMMQKLFSQQVRFKADDGSEFGEWEEKLIKDIADVKGGKRIPKGYPLVNENTGHPYITVSDMNRSYSIDSTNIRYVPLEVVDTIKRYTITDKDIFISVAGTLGIIGKIPTEFNGANLTENADKLTNLKCHQDFLIYLLDSGYLSELIESTATTSAQPKLALYAIEQLEVQIPCPEEQTKIANFLSAIDQKIEVVAQQIEQAKTWKKGLLQQMFI